MTQMCNGLFNKCVPLLPVYFKPSLKGLALLGIARHTRHESEARN